VTPKTEYLDYAKKVKFGGWLIPYELINEEFLYDCWREINKNAAYGVDQIRAREYEENLEANIRDLVDRLKRKTYRAKLVRRHYIPKADGKHRGLGIPIVRSYCTSIQWALGLLFQVSRTDQFHDGGYSITVWLLRPTSSTRPTLVDWLAQLGNDLRCELDPPWTTGLSAHAVQAATLTPVGNR